MNSLAYLSRQFDVLAAAPRAPPSTPTLEHAALLDDHDDRYGGALKRVKTWNRPLDLQASSRWSLKRSHSSPAEVYPSDPSSSTLPTAPRSAASTSKPPSRPPSRRPSISTSEKAIRPKLRSESLFHRIFFVHVLFSLWVQLCQLGRTVKGWCFGEPPLDIAGEESSDDEKDTEDEYKSEKPITLQVEQPSPIPPPLLPPSLSSFPSPVTRSDSAVFVLDTKSVAALESSTLAPSTAARIGEQQSRTPTPNPGTHKTPLHRTKTLVLDLDETLIHSTSRPMYPPSGSGLLSSFGIGRRNKGSGHTVEVVLGGRSTLYHVYKRPFVDYFLRKVSTWYTLVIFTASMQEYADPVIDWLDAGRGILGRRLFRESCTQLPNGSYTKDLTVVEQDLSRVCLIDNSPICYIRHEANGIPIEGWTNDPHDEALLDLLPVLDSLRFTNDVRRVLGIRGFS